MEISDFDVINPGDRLVVKYDLQAGEVYNRQTVMSEMARLADYTVTVKDIEKSLNPERGYDILIAEDKSRWHWSPGMFESIDNVGNVSLSDYLY